MGPYPGLHKMLQVLVLSSWVVSSGVQCFLLGKIHKTTKQINPTCSLSDTCCQNCERQQVIASKIQRIPRSLMGNGSTYSNATHATSLVLAKITKWVGRSQHIFDIKMLGSYLNVDAFVMKTSFWHLLPINVSALVWPVLLIIFKCDGYANDWIWLWKCWLTFPEMGICKEAVNWKYLEIYQEIKHILKGHLCTRSNQNQQYYHTGSLDNAAEVQLVSIMLH